MPIIIYFHALAHPKKLNIEHEVETVLEKIVNGEYQAVTLKKIANHLYSARINYADRLIFTVKNSVLVLLEIVSNHDYQKAKFLHPKVLHAYQAKIDSENPNTAIPDIEEEEFLGEDEGAFSLIESDDGPDDASEMLETA